MTAVRTFHFDEYMLRPVDESDRPFAINWTLADPDHRDVTQPHFWMEQSPTRDSYVLLDRWGRVFFLKMCQVSSDAVELHIQFPPEEEDDSREQTLRIARALIVGMDWLEKELKKFGIRRMAFDSVSQRLIKFAVKKLKFMKMQDFRLEKEIGV